MGQYLPGKQEITLMDHFHQLHKTLRCKKNLVRTVLPREEWSLLFVEWAKGLVNQDGSTGSTTASDDNESSDSNKAASVGGESNSNDKAVSSVTSHSSHSTILSDVV